MEPNHENSFWKSNVKMVPGRASPSNTRDFNRSTTVKAKNTANTNSTSFEKYQNSVSDAWTLSEDELTKEYCILTEDKIARRSNQNIARAHKNQIAVVHRHQASSSSALSNIPTNSATTSLTANNIAESTIVEEEVIEKVDASQKPQRKSSTEYG